MRKEKVIGVDEAAGLVRQGASLAIGGTIFQRKPMELVRALVRRGVSGLELCGFLGSMDVELLVGAGSVRSINYCYVGFEYLGMAPNFRRKSEEGKVLVIEHTEATMINGLRASAMGLPFLPAKASFGSEILDQLGTKIIRCPYTAQQVLACKPIRPDVAVLHALRSDPYGNVQGPRKLDFLVDTDYLMARAAKQVIITVEQIVSSDEVRRYPEETILFDYEVDAVVHAERGAYPTGYFPLYPPDLDHIQAYCESAKSDAGLEQYLETHIHSGSG